MNAKLIIIILLFFFRNSFAQVSDTAAARLNNYRDKIFTVFNKCNSQNDAITRAIKAKNVNEIETGRQALLQCATDGIKELNAIESFDGDPALKFSCRDVLKFYQQLAQFDIPQVSDFLIAEENFLKIKNEFQKKPVKKHSQSEVNSYNTEVKKYNEAVTHYDQLDKFISSSKKQTLNSWNVFQKIFMDAHRPKS